MGNKNYGIDAETLEYFCSEIKSIVDKNIQVAIVLGGGNIFRGIEGATHGFDRVQGDYMGMLATVINGLALQTTLEKNGISTKLLSGLKVEPISIPMTKQTAIQYLEEGKVVIISGGTGNPFFTTDSAAALRAVEIEADVILKGTRVDGVYNFDPEKNSNAKKFDNITFDEVYEKQLNIMDLTAFTLCKENNLPIIVFDFNKKGNLLKIIQGENIGTIIKK
jgi:uridylate kinase